MKIRNYKPTFFAIILFVCIVAILYPHYCFYIDPDGTSYLTISKRYAAGDFSRAINGYWSPWSCWLTAFLVKTGMEAIPASIAVNTIGGIFFLLGAQKLFIRFQSDMFFQWLANIVLSIFLCCAVYYQTFDDIWECAFLMFFCSILLMDGFVGNFRLWILCGVLAALSYFAKAYCFPFVLICSVFCLYVLISGNLRQLFKIFIVVAGTMCLVSFPWLWLLHKKYGIWTTSTAGSLNLSWYLIGHPHWKEGIRLLLPPTYTDSPYYWEDPYTVNANAPHFWNSLSLFGLQILRIAYTLIKFFISMLQVSVFFPAIIYLLLKKHTFVKRIPFVKYSENFTGKYKILVITFLLFPLGYLLINFESRYMWFMIPIGMILGSLEIQTNDKLKGKNRKLFYTLFILSFVIYQIYSLTQMYDEGKDEFLLASKIKDLKIVGSYTSNRHPRYMGRLAYFSGNPYFYNSQTQFKVSTLDSIVVRKHTDSLIDDMCRNKVDYYFEFRGKSTDDIAGTDFYFKDSLIGKMQFFAEMKNLKIWKVMYKK